MDPAACVLRTLQEEMHRNSPADLGMATETNSADGGERLFSCINEQKSDG